MADWRNRSEINQDVVFFYYRNEIKEKAFDEVFIWDLDKTYLDTSMQSLKDYVYTAIERALQKKNIPGTNTLLQVLGGQWVKQGRGQAFPLYYITASPPQLEDRIYEKILLDGISPVGCFYKDNLKNLTPSRFWKLTKQVGYKLQALMQLRTRLGENVKQICWGDDSESDAIIYNIYSDICSRRLATQDIRAVLRSFSVTNDQIDTILLLQAQVPAQDPIEKIYINLAEDTDADYYLKFGRRTFPTYNTFQIAIDLFQDSRITKDDVFLVAQDMLLNYGFSPEELNQSYDEMVRRQVVAQETSESLCEFLKDRLLFAKDYVPSIAPKKITKKELGKVYELEGLHEPWVPERIDYLHDYR